LVFSIRPEEIKSMALLQRKEELVLTERRRKEQRLIYLEMLQQLKKKDELARKNNHLKQEIDAKRSRKYSSRPLLQTTQPLGTPREHDAGCDERDEVKPWDVEPNPAQAHFTDIL
jgi:hypothetical protein